MLGHLSARDSIMVTLREGSFNGKPKDEVFERCKMPFKRASLSIGALLGNPEWVRLPGLLREKKLYLGSFLGSGGH